jgi:hypothetical protein
LLFCFSQAEHNCIINQHINCNRFSILYRYNRINNASEFISQNFSDSSNVIIFDTDTTTGQY